MSAYLLAQSDERAVVFHHSDGALRSLVDLLEPAMNFAGVIRFPSGEVKLSSSGSDSSSCHGVMVVDPCASILCWSSSVSDSF